MEQTGPKFTFDETKPVVLESWMTKANIGVFERWQRRIFRLQGRAIFYFKKEKGEPPCGYVPLIDVEVHDLPSKKGRQFGFSINIKSPNQIAKRTEYLICAETSETREQWKKAIMENRSKTIVGQPLIAACSLSPTSKDVHMLLPYFVPPLFRVLDDTGYKSRGIWTLEVPADTLNNMMHILNQNYYIPTDDVHNAVGALVHYLKQLPDSLLPSESIFDFMDKVTVEQIRAKVIETPAPTRQFLKVLGLHFKKVLDTSAQNGVTQYSLLPFLGPILIRAPSPSPAHKASITPAKAREIQDKVAQAFVSNVSAIFEDVHQFKDATKLQVRRKARVSENIQNVGEDVLEASRGLLINVVRSDYTGWCTVFTSNRRVGLIHEAYIKPLSQEEENELKSGPNIDAMLDIVREKVPDMMLLFDSMIEEAAKIRDSLEGG